MLQNIGPLEIGAIIVLALLVFGPAKLPELGKAIGKAIQEFRKAGKEITREVKDGIDNGKIVDNDKSDKM